MLWLPANTTHILQLLDVGAFKSLKNYYYKACKKYITEHPGRVITTEVIASLLATAWPQAVTLVNVMAGFKCGVYPLNPGEVTDHQIAPSNTTYLKQKECAQSEEISTSLPDTQSSTNLQSIFIRC